MCPERRNITGRTQLDTGNAMQVGPVASCLRTPNIVESIGLGPKGTAVCPEDPCINDEVQW